MLAKNLISHCIFCSNGITLITYLICFEHLVIRALHDILSNVLLEGDRFHVGAAEKLSLCLLFLVWERFSFLDFLAGHLSAPPPPLCIGRLTPGHPYTIFPVLYLANPILYPLYYVRPPLYFIDQLDQHCYLSRQSVKVKYCGMVNYSKQISNET